MRRWSYELNPDRNLTADVTNSHAPLSLNKCALMITFIHIVLWVWEWLRRHKKVDLQLKALKIVFTCVRPCMYVCVCVCVFVCVNVGGVAELCQNFSSAGCHDQRAVGPPIRLTPHAHTHTHIKCHSHRTTHTHTTVYTQPSISLVCIHRALYLKLRV